VAAVGAINMTNVEMPFDRTISKFIRFIIGAGSAFDEASTAGTFLR
jgi:hypothetical protein